MSSTTSRRTKWHPPPPTPKILHFTLSRRTRRKQPTPTTHHRRRSSNPLLFMNHGNLSSRENLENHFDRENNELNEARLLFLNSNSRVERRGRVEEECGGGGGGNGFEEEKWMFQAEMLRAECNILRMEREFALKKLERNRVKMERALRSAVHTLVSGRKKIFEGKNVNVLLEKEIEELSEKLEELHKSSRMKDYKVRKCSNFDKKAWILQRRLEKLGESSDDSSLKELQILPQSSSSINTSCNVDKQSCVTNGKAESKSTEVDELRKKMEGLSKGMLDRVEEEYGSMLSTTANCSIASSASTSKGIDCPNFSSFPTRQMHQEPTLDEDNRCSGRCKAIIGRIVEQVRAETEQWSQMQEMLGRVRGEMEELQASRDFWEHRAHNSDSEIQSLKHAVEEWKEKAHGYENKANELQLQLSVLQEELKKSEAEVKLETNRELKTISDPPRKQLVMKSHVLKCHLKENQCCDEFENAKDELNMEENRVTTPTKELAPISLAKQLAKEKRMLLLRLRDKRHDSERGNEKSKRSPLRDIGNSLSLRGQNGFSF
ncbi:uncharacterized protein LOC105170810 [Sesamum indicum]|uniref:Uncharacterized protein LOC105170810 n=1 Tax=Sesamum indicum TaxID=4182 RepID=A0A6I9TTG2_SESIN|nr:uncharacterized protein LOC105170810 [Sesamum indicum]